MVWSLVLRFRHAGLEFKFRLCKCHEADVCSVHARVLTLLVVVG